MVKLLKKYQIRSSPFNAAKNWALSNTNNQNLWLMEDTPDEVPVALEFLDYGDGSGLPVENAFCNIALEQQDDDKATVREGAKVSGPVFIDTEPINNDGTFKRTVYSQVKTMFYNNYRNPTEIWGTEKIDFELSETKLLLANRFRLLTVPQIVYGDKMVPNTIVILDESLDNLYYILDDGNGNLLAQKNLFSKFQAVGEFTNSFANGTSSFCDYYWPKQNVEIESDDATMDIGFVFGSIDSFERFAGDTSSFSMGFVGGFNVEFAHLEAVSSDLQYITGSNTTTVFTGSAVDYPTTDMLFSVGAIADTTIEVTGSDSSNSETASFDYQFVEGSNQTTTAEVTSSNISSSPPDTGSVDMLFVSGSMTTTTSESYHSGSLAEQIFGGFGYAPLPGGGVQPVTGSITFVVGSIA